MRFLRDRRFSKRRVSAVQLKLGKHEDALLDRFTKYESILRLHFTDGSRDIPTHKEAKPHLKRTKEEIFVVPSTIYYK